MTVGDRIRDKRVELGMSQEELANKMGYSSKSAVSRTENAGDDIGRKRVIAFAEALGCEPSELMGWTNNTLDIDIDIDCPNNNNDALSLYAKYLSADKKTRKMIDLLLEEGD